MTVGTQADLTSIGWLPYIGYAILEAVTTDTDTVLRKYDQREPPLFISVCYQLFNGGRVAQADRASDF